MFAKESLTSDSKIWIELTLTGFVGKGRIHPRLVFDFEARTPREEARPQLLVLDADLYLKDECLGQGAVRRTGSIISRHPAHIQIEVPITHYALRFIEEHFRDRHLSLHLDLRGSLLVRPNEPDTHQSSLSLPGGDFIDLQERQMSIPILRDEWVTNVLKPTGYGDRRTLELPMPDVPDRERWEQALAHLDTARGHWLAGNDPEVFFFCRAVFESLGRRPGSYAALTNPIPYEKKRKRVEDLLKTLNDYFQEGRHVAKEDEKFPVDHRDAELALGMATQFLVYLAKTAPSSESD